MKLAIIILSGDTFEILSRCLMGIKQNVLVEYKIYLGYNGKSETVELKILSFLKANFSPKQFTVIKYGFYNFAKLNNDIIRNHLDDGVEYILFCNNDIIIPGDCVNEMVYCMGSSSIKLGTVGCRLLYDNGEIQHDGQEILTCANGLFRGATHINVRSPAEGLDYKGPRSVVGNTFALCLSSLKTFEAVGGLNEKYVRCFEDVEYNLRCVQKKLTNVILPSIFWAFHLESYSRKQKDDVYIEKSDILELEGFFNKNFSGDKPVIANK